MLQKNIENSKQNQKTNQANLGLKIASFFNNIGQLWVQKIFLYPTVVTIIAIILQIAIILGFFSKFPVEIPLYYSKPLGNTQLAQPQFIFFLPGISFGFLLLNTILATSFFKTKRFLSVCLLFNSAILSLFLLITLINIVLIV